MAGYCEAADVVDFYPEAAELGDDTILRWVQRASTKVDSILGSRYAVPFATAPDLVKDITAELTAGMILVKVFIKSGRVDESPQGAGHIRAALQALAELRDNKTLLPGVPVDPPFLSSTSGTKPELLDHEPYLEPAFEEWLKSNVPDYTRLYIG